MVEPFKRRFPTTLTKYGYFRRYGPHLASSALLASHIVGAPWLGKYTLLGSLASLGLHEADDWTKVPTVGQLIRGKGTATSSFDALVLNTGIITGLFLFLGSHSRSYMGTDSPWKGEGVPSIFEIESIQNLPGFAPPSFDQAYGGQA